MEGEGNVLYRIVGIKDDMGRGVSMTLIQQYDGDVIVSLQDQITGKMLSAEFCSSQGGSLNPKIAKALRAAIKVLVDE